MADAKKPRTRKRKTRDEDDDFDGDGADDASGAASGPLDLDRPASAVAKSILASLGAVGGRAAMSERGSSPRDAGRPEASRLDHTQGGLRSDPSAGRGVGRRRKAPAAPSRQNRGTRIVPGESRRRRRRRRRGRARGSSARNHGSSLGNRGGAIAAAPRPGTRIVPWESRRRTRGLSPPAPRGTRIDAVSSRVVDGPVRPQAATEQSKRTKTLKDAMKLVVKELSTRSAKAARAAEATGGRAALVFSGQSVPTVVFQHLCGYASPRGDYGALMATTRAVMSTLGGTPRLWRRALDASPPGREPKRGRGDAAPEAALSRHRVPRGRIRGRRRRDQPLAGGNDSFRPACGRGWFTGRRTENSTRTAKRYL